MAIALQPSSQRVAHRARWVRQQPTESSSMLALLMLALLVVGIVTVTLSLQALPTIVPPDLDAIAQRSTPARPTDGAAPPGQTVNVSTAATTPAEPAASSEAVPGPAAAPAPVEAPDATPAPAASGLTVGQHAHVAHTDGVGVVLHSAPNQSARRPAGLMDGVGVTVLELADDNWARVQADNRQSGWVPASFLVGE